MERKWEEEKKKENGRTGEVGDKLGGEVGKGKGKKRKTLLWK